MNASPERSAQVTLVKWLRYVLPRGSMVAAVKNEYRADSHDKIEIIRFHQKRKAEGVKAGFPDMVICVPGRVIFAETKRLKGGVLSENQQDRHDELRKLGHPVEVVTDIESMRHFLQSEGVPLSEASGQLARPATYRMAPRKKLVSDILPF